MQENKDIQSRGPGDITKIILFFVLALFISWFCWLPSLLNTIISDFPQPLLIFGMFATWGPLIASIILLSSFDGKKGVRQLFKRAWHWRFKKTWLWAVIGLPFAFSGLSLVLKLVFENKPFALGIAPAAIFFTAFSIFFTGGPLEEFGWRGYALPIMLNKMGVLAASLVLGAVHAIWHLPLRFIPGTVQNNMPFWQFGLVTVVGAIIYTWIFLGTNGSLSAIIIHHWAGNVASALLVYWDTTIGRWMFFILQLLFAIVIVAVQKKKFLSGRYHLKQS